MEIVYTSLVHIIVNPIQLHSKLKVAIHVFQHGLGDDDRSQHCCKKPVALLKVRIQQQQLAPYATFLAP
jgi:hypothetical protein